MKVTWNDIINDLDRVLDEFEDLYAYQRNYAECEKVINEINKIYLTQFDIELDQEAGFDQIFHHLFTEMKNVIDKNNIGDVRADPLRSVFNMVADDTFKTAEVRNELKSKDSSRKVFKKAFKEGIKRNQKDKKRLEAELKNYKTVNDMIFKDGSVNLRDSIKKEKNTMRNLDQLKVLLDELESIRTTGADESSKLTQIDAVKNKLLADGVLSKLEVDSIDLTDITSAKGTADSLKGNVDNKLTQEYTKVRDNIIKVQGDPAIDSVPELKGVPITDTTDPTTQRDEIDNAYEPFLNEMTQKEKQIDLSKEKIKALKGQIKTINKEKKTLKEKDPEISDYINNIPADIKDAVSLEMQNYYDPMVEGQFYGNEQYEKKYKDFFDMFKNAMTNKTITLRDQSGNPMIDSSTGAPKTADIKTVDYSKITNELLGYPQYAGNTYEDVLKFLQLETYKNKLERISSIEAGDEFAKQEYEEYREFLSAPAGSREAIEAEEKYKQKLEKDKIYLDTYHLAPNEEKMKHDQWFHAGRVGETNLPIESYKGHSLLEAPGIFWHNFKADCRWKSLSEGHGLGKLGIAGKNVLGIFGGVTRKVVRNASRAYSGRYNANADPNPYKNNKGARRTARKEYYRDKENNGRFMSWAKAWSDGLPLYESRRQATEKAIIDKHKEDMEKDLLMQRVAGVTDNAKNELNDRKRQAEENQKLREEQLGNVLNSSGLYEDIFLDPENVNSDETLSKVMQYVGLTQSGKPVGEKAINDFKSRIRFANEDLTRTNQFKSDPQILVDMKDIADQGLNDILKRDMSSIDWTKIDLNKPENEIFEQLAADSIGLNNRDKAESDSVTRITGPAKIALEIAQMSALLAGVNHFINPTVSKTTIKKIHIKGNQNVNVVNDLNMEDLNFGSTASFDHTGTGALETFTEAAGASNMQAMALDFSIPSGLSQSTLAQLQQLGAIPGQQISGSVADLATSVAVNTVPGAHQYADVYAGGAFGFNGKTNLMQAINSLLPQQGKVLQTILNDPNMRGMNGVKFLEQAFSSAHGNSQLIQNANGWAQGWANEQVDANAFQRIINQKSPGKTIIRKTTKKVTNPKLLLLKNVLNGAITAEAFYAIMEDLKDITRESKSDYPGVETFKDKFGTDELEKAGEDLDR